MERSLIYKILGGFCVFIVLIFLGWFLWSRNGISITTPQTGTTEPKPVEKAELFPDANLLAYVEITDGCGPYYTTGLCVNMRSGPGTNFSVLGRLRSGVVLQVERQTVTGKDGREWYKIIFDKGIRYPERVSGDWYIAVDPTSVRPFQDVGEVDLVKGMIVPKTKRIVVDISKEMLYAYDGDTLFMQDPVSTGLEFTATPLGTFTVFKKTPSRYMQGPLPGVSDQVYDLPGVPWDLYFTKDGAVVHGAYWHDHFGEPWSHGCVNLAPQEAKKLYDWAPVGITVTIQA